MYCSKCLAEDKVPYFRKKWRYFFYNACPKHKVLLTDRCWRCYERINFIKIKHFNEICICPKCEKDLRENITIPIQSNLDYGLKAIKWFEKGLNRGYFLIGKQKVNSLFIFESFTHLTFLLDRKEKLVLYKFPLINEYKDICRSLQQYNSKKKLSIKKDFILTSMVYYLFQDYPKNFINFIIQNKLIHRDFLHGFKDIPFWYEKIIDALIPMQNKIGREISDSEVFGAIKYLKNQNKVINQKNVAEIIGCHFTIHKGFVKIYKSFV